jgi:hypothetical protein
VFGNVGTMISFRVGAFDSEVLEKEFAPVFVAEDLVNLGFTQIYLKLMIDGVSSQPFSANSLPPIKKPTVNYKDDIVESSRKAFAQPKADVEELIRKWHEPVVIEKKPARLEPRADQTPSAPTSSPVKLVVSAPPQPPRTPAPVSAAPAPRPPQPAHSQPQPQSQPQSQPAREQQRPPLTQQSAPVKTTLPLSALKKPQSKGPTPQNLSQLKDALKELVEKTKKEEQTAPAKTTPKAVSKPAASSVTSASSAQSTPKENPTQREPRREPQAAKTTMSDSTKPNEVPEDVLRRILDIGKKK